MGHKLGEEAMHCGVSLDCIDHVGCVIGHEILDQGCALEQVATMAKERDQFVNGLDGIVVDKPPDVDVLRAAARDHRQRILPWGSRYDVGLSA